MLSLLFTSRMGDRDLLNYRERAEHLLVRLSKASEQDEALQRKLQRAFRLCSMAWGDYAGANWTSDASNDGAPFEFSIALDQTTANAEVRFLAEAHPQTVCRGDAHPRVIRLAGQLIAEYSRNYKAVAFVLHQFASLFPPTTSEGKKMVLWHSFAVSSPQEKWKIYFDPRVYQSPAKAVIFSCLDYLGLMTSWELLNREGLMSSPDSIAYCCVGFSPDPTQTELKVYVTHERATVGDIQDIHKRLHSKIDEEAIEKFCSTLGEPSHGRYAKKALMSCFAFSTKNPLGQAWTVLFPIDEYTEDDAEAKRRIRRYMHDLHLCGDYRQRYEDAVRALEDGVAKGKGRRHCWVGLKARADGGMSNTYYLSSGMGPVPRTGF